MNRRTFLMAGSLAAMAAVQLEFETVRQERDQLLELAQRGRRPLEDDRQRSGMTPAAA